MKTKIVFSVSALCLGLLAFSLFVVAEPVQAVSAQSQPARPTPIPWRETLAPVRATLSALPTQNGAVLENLLIRARLALSNQQTRLSLAHTVAEATQDYIDNQKKAGKDTSALESALSAFNQAIGAAEADNAAAGNLLANPAGFDASGQVVEPSAALQTLRDAGHLLRQAHLTLSQATLDLRTALQNYRGK